MRPGRTAVLLATAELWAQRSTCERLSVGCVIAREGRILVQGYNGSPSGLPHCDHSCTCELKSNKLPPSHHPFPCNSGPEGCRAVHAEQNAIAWAAREGVRIGGADLYCTHQPCLTCARSIINAGVESVHYIEPYRLKDGLDLLNEAGVRVTRWVADGSALVIGSNL